MPRRPREISSTGIYHIMLRGINRQHIFEDDEDLHKFLEVLEVYKSICEYRLYGYCLMGNHVHLLMHEHNEPISSAMKRLGSSYVHWFNKKYDRVGHLFQGRFRSETVENDAYFMTVLRYIHQNPLKAGLVRSIEQYEWSSYQEYIGVKHLVDIDFALSLFSSEVEAAKRLFQAYSEENNDDRCLEVEDEPIVSSDEVVRNFLGEMRVNVSELQRLVKEERDAILRSIKNLPGVSLRQVARVTGISKSVIDRVWTKNM